MRKLGQSVGRPLFAVILAMIAGGIVIMITSPGSLIDRFNEAITAYQALLIGAFGNPQNLFLWQLSHTSFLHFFTGMAPLVSVLGSLLLLWMFVVFHPTPITVRSPDTPRPVNTRLLLLSLALYGPFVVSIEWHQPLLGAAVVLVCYLLSFPAVVRQID